MRHPASVVKLAAAVAIAGICSTGCSSVLGPSCIAQQKTGTVTEGIHGAVAAGAVVSHLVPYDVKGSQNNLKVAWTGQGTVNGPRLKFYATWAGCENFVAPSEDLTVNPNVGDCRIIASPNGYLAPYARACAKDKSCAINESDIVQTSLTVTGPGNGKPADFREYKLWVVGDATQDNIAYVFSITWFFGPDC
jgi:hypothetical protein